MDTLQRRTPAHNPDSPGREESVPAIGRKNPFGFAPERAGDRKIGGFWRRIRHAHPLMPFLLWILFVCPTASEEMNGIGFGSPEGRTQQDPKANPGNYKISVHVNLVTTDVRIIGKNLSRLEANDFVVYDDKVSQELTFYSYDQLPIAVALLIDESGSVRPYFPLLQIAALLSLKNLKPEDLVSLFSFSDSCKKLSGLTKDRLRVAGKVSKLEAYGGTYIFPALSRTARFLHKEAPDRRRAIILISDNCSNESKRSVAGVLADLLEASATLYSIRTPGINGPGCTESNDRVREIVEGTGGGLFEVDASTSMQTALERAIANIRYQYTIGFSPSNPGEKGSYHTLDVQLRSPELCAGCRILTRKGYYAGIHPPALPEDHGQPVSQTPAENADELLIQRSILTAGTTELELPDIPFAVETAQQEESPNQPQLEVRITIDPSGIGFKKAGGLHICNLHVAVFYAERNGKILGYDWNALQRQYSGDGFSRAMKEGILYKTKVPIKAEKRMLKIVVYSEESNKIGSRLVLLPK